MNRAMHRAALPAAAILTVGLAASACGSSSHAAVTLTGAGSSAQQAAQAAWQAGFGSSHSYLTVNYTPSGSGAGVTSFNAGSIDYAGSDSALAAGTTLDAAKTRCGGDVLEVPDYVSPIAIVFTLSGVDKLNLDADTVAKIFSGAIKKWNDPAIAAQNDGVTLPATAINPVYRSDKSGTTKNFTDYLAKAAATSWTNPAADTWPAGLAGEGASGTSGVIASAKHEGSIGYADLSQAKGVSVASIKVGSDYVKPTADGAAKALAASPLDTSMGANQIVVKLDRKTTAAGAYPLALVSYLIACPTYSADKADTIKGFLGYIVSTDGQSAAGAQAGSAPLPASLQAKAASVIAGIKSK